MAGEISEPNTVQKLLHRFFMLRPVTAFFAPWVHRVDNTLLQWTHGKFSAGQILGWPIVQLTTVGAKTNQLRTVPLLGIFAGEKIVLIASSLGRAHNPGWYYNLKTHPDCEVSFHGKTRKYTARESTGEEYTRCWQLGVAYYAGYEKYRRRAHRQIPIMVLVPKT